MGGAWVEQATWVHPHPRSIPASVMVELVTVPTLHLSPHELTFNKSSTPGSLILVPVCTAIQYDHKEILSIVLFI